MMSSRFNNKNKNKNKLKNKTIYSDRLIPNRIGIDLQAAYSINNIDDNLLISSISNTSINNSFFIRNSENDMDLRREEEANITFSTVLKAELFGDNVPQATAPIKSTKKFFKNLKKRPSSTELSSSLNIFNNSNNNISNNNNINNNDNLLLNNPINNSVINNNSFINNYNSLNNDNNNIIVVQRSPPHSSNLIHSNSFSNNSIRSNGNLFTYQSSPSKFNQKKNNLSEFYSLSPIRSDTQRLLLSPQKKPRSISKVPYRVLDAPELADDFYLNLVDWGSQDILGVGLGSCVYLWDSSSGAVNKLCDLGDNNKVTSISWIGAGSHLAVGSNNGLVAIWDAKSCKCTRTMTGHTSRAAALAWNEHILTSGSRDRTILHRDVRVPEHYIQKIEAHKQEICGLKWNIEENKLASGGNDNRLMVWDGINNSEKPLYKISEHRAAVKAISWSPHQRGILASGGGTADRRIKVWNTLNGNKVSDTDTGSQVCNLMWSKNSNEIVSTHGYAKHQIVIWKYPTMQQIASLTGHTYRVLYLAMSSDGQTIVTGAGDETLRFWNVFDKSKHENGPSSLLLDALLQLR
ncbi:Cdh1p [Ascoidea rubescens DSM 1968]|uniref:WD40 repeat-like protein n=1 Tax=Ascoidea rubescens DSM 1968 TaxID=1344418 RepID=A0A1D2VK92_9ASCO|nr:WD40 repeat-like protein [Ascoidea rubescens DSM 1968]ODV62024.1 WD40 repeat-like protein [Ascoidea rubescens DSM 1968]